MNNSIKILIIIFSLALFANCDNSSNIEEDEKLLMVTFEDSLSYSMGINMAQNLPETQLNHDLVKEGVLVRERSGLQYKVIVKGSGIIPDYDDRVVIHYTGYLIDGYKFDSSYNMGTPLTLEVARFIPGWQEALLMMPVGSKWEIYVPYNLAYGDAGIQGSNLGEYVIPPSSTLIFEMELLAIAK